MTKRYTKEEFIKKAISIYGDVYDYSKVEYVNSKTKVCIIVQNMENFGKDQQIIYLEEDVLSVLKIMSWSK